MVLNTQYVKLKNIMIIAIDIGGTKTLVAMATSDGKIVKQVKFLSIKNYKKYIKLLSKHVAEFSKDTKITRIAIGCPGSIDRKLGEVKKNMNLGWRNEFLVKDLSKLTNIPENKIIIENDANLAGLSEAQTSSMLNLKVLYITFSTGIGTAFMDNGRLVPSLLDSEGGYMVFEHEGQIVSWESIASGHAMVNEYSKTAAELNDKNTWAKIVKNMAFGIVNNCAIFQPDTVIIGGGVGSYFTKYDNQLNRSVKQLLKKAPMVKMPTIIQAQEPEEAVIRGCVILAQQHNEQY